MHCPGGDDKKGKMTGCYYSFFRTLEPLQFKQLGTRMPTALAGESEETAARRVEEQKERAKKLEQRSALEIGLNQVMRALEKGSLRLVLVSLYFFFKANNDRVATLVLNFHKSVCYLKIIIDVHSCQ